MPNILKTDKNFIIEYLKRKGYDLLTYDGEIISAEELEQEDFDKVLISLHG